MRARVRVVSRIVSALVAVAVLVGLPVVVVHVDGVPFPTRDEWRTVWTAHQVDSRFVVHVGLTIVCVLWLWFATTATAELAHVIAHAHRADDSPAVGPACERQVSGPSHLLRRWIRFIAVSSVAATGSVVVFTGGLGSRVEHPTVVSAPATVPAATAQDRGSSNRASVAELAGLSMFAAGVLVALQRLRRRRLRAAPRRARVAPPSVDDVRFEVMLRSTTAMERIARLDHATRLAARALIGTTASVVAARVAPDGAVRLRLSEPMLPSDVRWLVGGDDAEWLLAPGVVFEPDHASPDSMSPNPLLVSVGVDSHGCDCFVDVGAIGALVVDSPDSDAVLRTMAASLALSPFMDHGTVLTVGVGDVPVVDRPVERCPSVAAAVARAARVVDEPVVVVAAGCRRSAACAGDVHAAVADAGSAHPRGAVVDGGEGWCRLVAVDGHHRLEPWGWTVIASAVPEPVIEAAHHVLDVADRAVERVAPVLALEPVAVAAGFVEPEWQLLVRLLGPVEVVSADGVAVAFERSKAMELVAWLVLHRERPTRSKARAALWDAAVTAATFSNVVSDARRSLARVMPPPPEQEWIARTLTEDLALHPLVVSDADLLAARVDAARGLPSFEAIGVLRPGLELVAGLPFESSCYAWPDAEGHASALVLLATDAASELAGHYLALGDIDGVFWATGQGLRVLSAHEELIAMRMRAHAARGDRSGVRHEWESYERALAADPWSLSDPSPKLVALRAELLRSDAWATSDRAARSMEVGA